MIPSGGAITPSVKAFVTVCGVPAVESATRTVKEKAPLVVGVPDNAPPGESVRPLGRAPALMDHVYGAFPALAVKVWLYDWPCVAGDHALGVVIASPGTTVSVKAFVAVCGVPAVESVTRTVKEKLPVAVGVPDNTP
jgi:hypothetical protein